MLIHLTHVLHHSVPVLLVWTDQRADTLRINIRVRLHITYLGKVVLRAGHLHGRIHQLWGTVHSLLNAALVTVIREPLILSGDRPLWLAIEAANLFLFLVIHVLIRQIAKEVLLSPIIIHLLR